MKFDNELLKQAYGEKIEYGFVYGDEKIVFIKTGAYGRVCGKDDIYLKMAYDIHDRLGATVICANNPDIECYLKENEESLDEKSIRWIAKKLAFKDYKVYFFGTSDGGYKVLDLAKKVPQTVKVVGVNVSFTYVPDLIEKVTAIEDIEKIFVCGSKDEDSCSYVEPLKNANVKNLEFKIIEGANHEFSGMTDTFIALANLI